MPAAFIVEGIMEQKIVQRLCPGIPVRLVGTGGRDAAPAAIAKFLSVQIKDLLNRYYPIFIVCDREKRSITATELKAAVMVELLSFGYKENIFVYVADVSIENWIYADSEIFERIYGAGKHEYCGDGNSCTTKIGNRMKECNDVYNKTTSGVRLFSSIIPDIVSQNSERFKEFRSGVSPHCEFLR